MADLCGWAPGRASGTALVVSIALSLPGSQAWADTPDPSDFKCVQMVQQSPPKWRRQANALRSADRWASMLRELADCTSAFAVNVNELREKASAERRGGSIDGTSSPASLTEPLGDALQARVGGSAPGFWSGTTLEAQALALRRRAAYLKKWIGAVTKVDGRGTPGTTSLADPEDIRRTLEAARDGLDTALDLLGLRQWLSAELVPGIVYGDASGDSSAAALTYVRLESRHVSFTYDEDRNFDFSVAGGLGMQPTLTLVKLTPVPAVEDARPQPPSQRYKQAFVWEMQPQFHLHFARDQAQLSLFGRAGQALLFNTAELREGALGLELASLYGNDGSRTSWFFGGGIGLQLVQRGRSVLHEQKDADSPLDVALSYVYDLRFRQDATSPVMFNRPEHRLGVRLSLNLPLKRSDPGDPARKDKASATSLGFTVEHEFALYGASIPSSTKVSFRGDTNIIKLLK